MKHANKTKRRGVKAGVIQKIFSGFRACAILCPIRAISVIRG
jgi:hypothetical protein